MAVAKNILERWHDDDKNSKSLSKIEWTQEQIIQYDAIASEDHSYFATRQERSRNGKFWKISLSAEGIQRPLNQRSDFIEANQKCKRLLDEHTAITGDGNKLIPPEQQVRQRLDQQFDLVQDGDSILPPRRRIHLRHQNGNQAATGSQIEAGIRGKHHPGLNNNLFLP